MGPVFSKFTVFWRSKLLPMDMVAAPCAFWALHETEGVEREPLAHGVRGLYKQLPVDLKQQLFLVPGIGKDCFL